MGRQMRFYLLPQEADELVAALRNENGLDIYAYRSLGPSPSAQQSLSSSVPIERSDGLRSYPRVYLAPPRSLSPAFYTYKTLDSWQIETASDVIEFDSCAFDSSRLVQGRMYYQHDRLSGNTIILKNGQFVKWAESIFRSAKRKLLWSRELEAYIGRETDLWRQQGGTFFERVPASPIDMPAISNYVA